MSERHICPMCGTELVGADLKPELRIAAKQEAERLEAAENALEEAAAVGLAKLRDAIKGGQNG